MMPSGSCKDCGQWTYGTKQCHTCATIELAKHLATTPRTAFITWDDEITKKIDLNDLFKDKPEPKKNYCYPHHWIKYTGLNEVDWHCKYCNEKRKD